ALALNELERSLRLIQWTNLATTTTTTAEKGGGTEVHDAHTALDEGTPYSGGHDDNYKKDSIADMVLSVFDNEALGDSVVGVERRVLQQRVQHITFWMANTQQELNSIITDLLHTLDGVVADTIDKLNTNNISGGVRSNLHHDEDTHRTGREARTNDENNDGPNADDQLAVVYDDDEQNSRELRDVITFIMSASFRGPWIDPVEVYEIWKSNLYSAKCEYLTEVGSAVEEEMSLDDIRLNIAEEWRRWESEKQQRDGQHHGPSDFLIGRSKRNAERYELSDTEDDDDDDDNMKLTRTDCIRYSPDSYRHHHDVTKRCQPLVQRPLFYLTLKTSLSDSIRDLIYAFGDVLLIRQAEEEAEAAEAITIISLYDIIYGIGYLPSLPPMPSATPAIPPLSKFQRLLDHLAFDHTLGDHHQHVAHPATPPKGGSPEVPLRCLWLKDALEVVLSPQSVLRGGDDPLVRL
ncbi:hypothetical protein FOZ63_033475, partial [Perkinsus olseni]